MGSGTSVYNVLIGLDSEFFYILESFLCLLDPNKHAEKNWISGYVSIVKKEFIVL